MLSNTAIELKNVWKKYSTKDVLHKSLREEVFNFLKRRNSQGLRDGEFWALKAINLSLEHGECLWAKRFWKDNDHKAYSVSYLP
jgi:ABC-type polysaccharide/polyol phosphate transport system ATPase subunit